MAKTKMVPLSEFNVVQRKCDYCGKKYRFTRGDSFWCSSECLATDLWDQNERMKEKVTTLLAYLDSDDVFLTDRPTGNCSGRRSEKLARLLEEAKREVQS